MRTKFWNMYLQTKADYDYFSEYTRIARRWNNGISIFLAFTSTASIAAWSIWESVPLLWTALIVAAQVVSLLKPYLPFEKRISTAGYYLPELQSILNSIDHYFSDIDISERSDKDINDTILEYSNKLTVLENKYSLLVAIFPCNEKIMRKSEIRTEAFFKQRYYSNIDMKG